MDKLIKIIIILSVVAFATTEGRPLDIDPVLKIDVIKGEGNYVWGEGYGDTQAEANQNALQQLLASIGLTVNSMFTQEDVENSVNGVIEAKSNVSSIVNSYSHATVNNCKRIEIKDKKGGYYHFIYMSRSELDKMFGQRMDRIENYVREALRYEEGGKIGDAIRNLNWAYVLMQSLQYPGQAKMTAGGEELLLVNWIPSKIREILDDISVEIAGYDADENFLDVLVSYKGKNVVNADFTYWTGSKNQLDGVKDGIARLDFDPGLMVDNPMLVIETSYAEASACDRELETLIKTIQPLKFSSAKKQLGVEGRKIKATKSATANFQAQVSAGKNEGVQPVDKKTAKEYDRIISEVLKSVSDKSYKPREEYFTEDGLDMFKRLLTYGNATILGTPELGYYPFGNRIVARSVPMKFSFKNNRKSFVEDVTFTFSPEKKIESVAFGLGSSAREDIFNQGVGVWSDSVKMVIVTFLENYKTAFALKRFDYINSIFDENAYIIVGHKLEPARKVNGDISGLSFMPQYEYALKSKHDYMSQLKKCFASNEFVNINFSDNDVQKSFHGGDTFGIQIKQDYHSEHYGDQGYLFLFVDLNDADHPIIKIRTWQPERNPDLTPLMNKNSRDYGIYGNHLLK